MLVQSIKTEYRKAMTAKQRREERAAKDAANRKKSLIRIIAGIIGAGFVLAIIAGVVSHLNRPLVVDYPDTELDTVYRLTEETVGFGGYPEWIGEVSPHIEFTTLTGRQVFITAEAQNILNSGRFDMSAVRRITTEFVNLYSRDESATIAPHIIVIVATSHIAEGIHVVDAYEHTHHLGEGAPRFSIVNLNAPLMQPTNQFEPWLNETGEYTVNLAHGMAQAICLGTFEFRQTLDWDCNLMTLQLVQSAIFGPAVTHEQVAQASFDTNRNLPNGTGAETQYTDFLNTGRSLYPLFSN